ncbi:hypothetical protein C8035_v004521 [Colletotrichum spinosum]|uniref:G domain-containing protein n=1 Tax=Colletotrichum spinosum TaxID=1347390 RepID=A0A4R8PMM6_9PEZI|nr:hypothetical protein C8035_v004521 [Colletotrichum spinosum]
MEAADIAREELEESARRFLTFTGAMKPSPNALFLLVMGMTGAGKSSFISAYTGKSATIFNLVWADAWMIIKGSVDNRQQLWLCHSSTFNVESTHSPFAGTSGIALFDFDLDGHQSFLLIRRASTTPTDPTRTHSAPLPRI